MNAASAHHLRLSARTDLAPGGRGLLCLVDALMMLMPLVAAADWSPEIVLYENPPSLSIPGRAWIATDADENVHIVYNYMFYRVTEPIYAVTGIAYLKFDDHGNQITDLIQLTDSLQASAEMPNIHLFSSDSLLVMWAQHTYLPSNPQFVIRTMDVTGLPLGNVRVFQDSLLWTNWPRFAFDITSSDWIIVAYGDTSGEIRTTVQLPTGQRIMDRMPAWATQPNMCDEVDGFVDQSDSLQLVWRQRTGGDAIYAKRVAIDVPFDPSHMPDHVALTPVGHAVPGIQPIGDSLLVFLDGGSEIGPCDYRMRLLQRDTYQEVTQVLLGPCTDFVPTAREPNGQISLFTYVGYNEDRNLHFQRYSVPALTMLEDTAVIRVDHPGGGVGLCAYAVSPAGVRHVVYWKSISGSVRRLYYRYWRADLEAGYSDATPHQASFAVSPNPSGGFLRLNGPLQDVASLTVWNLLAQRVATIPIAWPKKTAGSAEFRLELSAGIYFLRIETRKTAFVQKFVLVH